MTDVYAKAIPLKTVSVANRREHWTARHRRTRAQRLAVAYAMADFPRSMRERPCTVTLRRIGKRLLDDDNLAGSFKAIRDEVAAMIGLDDCPGSGISWVYEQERGSYSVLIVVEADHNAEIGLWPIEDDS